MSCFYCWLMNRVLLGNTASRKIPQRSVVTRPYARIWSENEAQMKVARFQRHVLHFCPLARRETVTANEQYLSECRN